MTPAELRRRDVQVLDVRWPNEWEAGRIDGSVHIPQDELDDRLAEIDRSRPVVTVCRSGSRSAEAAQRLREEGFDAENLDGGVKAWVEAGFELTTPSGEPGTVAEPEPPVEGHEKLQAELLKVMFEVDEHFGGREASDQEVRDYLRRRLVEQGRNPEEADAILSGTES